jgi:hypothetical protein
VLITLIYLGMYMVKKQVYKLNEWENHVHVKYNLTSEKKILLVTWPHVSLVFG